MPSSRQRLPIRVQALATILEAPEGDSWVALVDVQAKTQDEALAAAWKAYKPNAKWPLKVSNDLPDRDGWSRRRVYQYLDVAQRKAGSGRLVFYSGSSWTVAIVDVADAVAGKRGAQLSLIFGRLLPKGYSRESFAGKKAKPSESSAHCRVGPLRRAGTKSFGHTRSRFWVWFRMARSFRGGFGVKELGAYGEARRRHTVHDRFEHQGDDHTAARQTRR